MARNIPQIPQASQESQAGYRNRSVTMPPGRGAAVDLAVQVYESAKPEEDWQLVAERMYRALKGVEVSPFPARKGIKGLSMGRPGKD